MKRAFVEIKECQNKQPIVQAFPMIFFKVKYQREDQQGCNERRGLRDDKLEPSKAMLQKTL